MENEFADDGAVSGDVTGAFAAVVFAKDDVQNSGQAVFDTPVPPHITLKSSSGRSADAQVMSGFGRGHTRGSGRAHGHDFDQGSQSDPLGAAQHGGQAVGGQDLAGAGFHPPMGGLFVGRGCRLGAGGSVSALMYAIKAKLTVLMCLLCPHSPGSAAESFRSTASQIMPSGSR